MYHSFLIHSSVDGHLGCFHVLAIINSAALNIGVNVSVFFNYDFLRACESSEIIEKPILLILVLGET